MTNRRPNLAWKRCLGAPIGYTSASPSISPKLALNTVLLPKFQHVKGIGTFRASLLLGLICSWFQLSHYAVLQDSVFPCDSMLCIIFSAVFWLAAKRTNQSRRYMIQEVRIQDIRTSATIDHTHQPSVASLTLLMTLQGQSLQLRKIWRSPPCHRIPAFLRREPCGITPSRTSTRDVRERFVPFFVQPWIQKAQRRLARCDQGIVDQRYDSRSNRSRGAGAIDRAALSPPGIHDRLALSCDVGVSATIGIVEAFVLAPNAGKVRWDDVGLILRASKVVAKASTASEAITLIIGGDLGVEILCCAH